MKKTLFIIAVTGMLFTTSCNTSQKLFEAQEYDQVIMKEAPRVCSGNTNAKKIGLLAASYHRANQADHERIQALKASGQPEVWLEIFERYTSIKGRNKALSCLPKRIKQDINYMTLNLDDELTAAHNKAEAYLTASLTQRLTATEADPDETDRMIKQLEEINPENAKLNDFKIMALAKRYGDLSRLMHVEVLGHQVTPDRDETVTFKESAGGLTATVTDHVCSKSATLKGKVRFIDPKSKRTLLSVPFETSSKFNATYTTIEGPSEACTEQTLARLKQPRIPFPTDDSLLQDAERQLVERIEGLTSSRSS